MGWAVCALDLCALQRCVDWSGQRSRFVRLRRTGTCPNETDKTASVSDTLHTSAEHRDPGRRTPPTRPHKQEPGLYIPPDIFYDSRR